METGMDGLRGEEDDDLPIFRPRMGGGRRPKDRIGSTSLRNAVLANLRRPPRHSRSSSKVGGADRATPRPEPGAALALGTPDAIPSCERRDGRAGREGAATLDTAPCGVHPSVSCWKSEDGNGAAREDSDIDSGVDGGKGEEGVFESGSGE